MSSSAFSRENLPFLESLVVLSRSDPWQKVGVIFHPRCELGMGGGRRERKRYDIVGMVSKVYHLVPKILENRFVLKNDLSVSGFFQTFYFREGRMGFDRNLLV